MVRLHCDERTYKEDFQVGEQASEEVTMSEKLKFSENKILPAEGREAPHTCENNFKSSRFENLTTDWFEVELCLWKSDKGGGEKFSSESVCFTVLRLSLNITKMITWWSRA